MTDEEFFEEEVATILLVDEEGNEHLFELISELEIEGQYYKVLVPLDDEILEEGEKGEEEEVEVVILKVTQDENGDEILCDIDDDEEWEKVADAWQELMESEEIW